MASPKDKIRNVILCEDIREEIGNKKSLMGIVGGDILVATLPATIQVAVYFEYVPDANESGDVFVEFRLWLDDEEIAKGAMLGHIRPDNIIVLIVHRGLMTFEKDGTFRMTAVINGSPDFELFSKKVTHGPIS